jgi:hypothetical protein
MQGEQVFMWWNPYAGLSKLLHRMCICTDAESHRYTLYSVIVGPQFWVDPQTLSSPTVRS